MLHGTSHWKATIHTYSFQKVFETSTTLGAYASLPKIRNGHSGYLKPLGLNNPSIPEFPSRILGHPRQEEQKRKKLKKNLSLGDRRKKNKDKIGKEGGVRQGKTLKEFL